MASPRDLPSIDLLKQLPGIAALETTYGPAATRHALRAATDALRRRLVARDAVPPDLAAAIEAAAAEQLASRVQGSLWPLLNATGVVIHTNLGRAPLSTAALERIAATGGGYTNLEYDLERGERGSELQR